MPQLDELDKEKLKKAFDISNFDLNAVIRGIQLTLVGGMSMSLYRTITSNKARNVSARMANTL